MRILVIAPHPDDAEYGVGGFLVGARLAAKADTIIACLEVRPEFGTRDDLSDVAFVRRQEAERSAALLAAELVWLDWTLNDGQLPLLEQLVNLFREVKPDLVLTVDPNDAHPLHVRVSEAVHASTHLSALPTIRSAPALAHPPQLGYIEAFSTGRFDPDLYINVTPWFRTARQALLVHHTGLSVTPALEFQMRASHVRHGAAAAVPFAEGLRLARGYAQDWATPRSVVLSLIAQVNNAAHSADSGQ